MMRTQEGCKTLPSKAFPMTASSGHASDCSNPRMFCRAGKASGKEGRKEAIMTVEDAVKGAKALSTLNDKAADRFVRGELLSIVDAVADMRLDGGDEAEVGIGFGTLRIRFDDGALKWRFEPNEALEKACVDAAMHKKNLLVDAMGKSLSAKLTGIYKDLL